MLPTVAASLRAAFDAARPSLRTEAEDAFEASGFDRGYAERLIAMLEAFGEVVGEAHEALYARGLHEGRQSARWLEDREQRVHDVVERLADVRTPFFFERLPQLAAPAHRSELVGQIATFITGYSRGINVSDDVSSRRRLGISVRRLTTAASIDEVERVAADAAIDLLKTDYAWFVRREKHAWTLSHERGAASGDDVVARLHGEQLEALMSGETIADHSPERGSTLSVPIVVDGELCGALVIGYRNRTTFTPQEHATIEILASQAAATMREKLAVDRLRTALRRQREIATALQQAFVPRALPVVPGFAFDAVYIPAENDAYVGGDWYDVFVLSDELVAFSIGDVTGHGIEAAAKMGQIRHAIYIAMLDEVDPAAVLRKVNRGVLALDGGVATAIVGFIEPRTHLVRYANAGHPPPIVARNGAAQLLPYGSVPLGVQADLDCSTHELGWFSDTSMVLYTDGVVEATRDAVEGERRLCEAVARLAGGKQAGEAALICRAVVGAARSHDDMALLVIGLGAGASAPSVPIRTGSTRVLSGNAQAV